MAAVRPEKPRIHSVVRMSLSSAIAAATSTVPLVSAPMPLATATSTRSIQASTTRRSPPA